MKTKIFALFLGLFSVLSSASAQSVALTGFNGRIDFSGFANSGPNIQGTLKNFTDQTGTYVASQIDTGDVAWDNNGKRYAVVGVISSTATQAVVVLSRIGGGAHLPKGIGLVSRETPNGLTLIPTQNSAGISSLLLGRILTNNTIRTDFLTNNKLIKRDSLCGVAAFYTDIKIKGTYIYACSPSLGRVVIYDAAFPKDTVKSFRPNFSGLNFLPTIIKTQGNDLYVLCFDDAGGGGASRIFKYNATDPVNPVLMWSRDVGGGYYPSDFAINDTLIYIMRTSNVEIISSLNNYKGNFGPGGTPNSIQFKDGKIYLFGRRTFSVLDTAYFSVFNASTIVPTLVARYKSALDSNYLGGYIDSDYIFLISNSNTTLLRSSNLSLVKRNKLPNVNQAVYHFPYSKYKAKAVKFNEYVIASSAASTYMYLFSYPEFNILNQQDTGENLMWFDLVGNTFHGIRGDNSQAPKQIVKGILNFNLH